MFKLSKKILLSSSLLLASSQLFALPNNVRISRVDAHGTGCPPGSAYINISPDRQVFTAIFDEFQAIIDPRDPYVSYSDRHKRCDLALTVHVPQGWQFSIFKADYEGWYDLERGMSLTQTSTYHFQGNKRHRKRSRITTRNRPKNGEFIFTDKMGVQSLEWSACGGPRNMFISSELRLSSRNRSSSGVAGIDAIEGQFSMKAHYGIRWRRCR
ncbi:MAG: hypothetical protein CMP11_02255 [Zetaproteobacteria bacterium]|nr:hypothetical protein [Pseudobdellovibrionaceae bacterium]|tara:strand:+ start:90 stop:725 length:636 start_codon:yes stop_codon:yes gene_type:complete